MGTNVERYRLDYQTFRIMSASSHTQIFNQTIWQHCNSTKLSNSMQLNCTHKYKYDIQHVYIAKY